MASKVRQYPSRTNFKERMLEKVPAQSAASAVPALLGAPIEQVKKIQSALGWKWPLLALLTIAILASPARRPALKAAKAWLGALPLKKNAGTPSRLLIDSLSRR